jgi:hypothetical protein
LSRAHSGTVSSVSVPTPYASAMSLIGLDVLLSSRHNSFLNSLVNFRGAGLVLISTLRRPSSDEDPLSEISAAAQACVTLPA